MRLPSFPPKKPKKTEPDDYEPTYGELVQRRREAEIAALPPALRPIAEQAEQLTDLYRFKE